MSDNNIISMLRFLGITRRYAGFSYLLHAVRLVKDDPSRLEHVVRDVYFPIADLFSVDWRNVEQNIRTLTHRAWQTDKRLLSDIAGYHLTAAPSVSQFIEMLTFHLFYRE